MGLFFGSQIHGNSTTFEEMKTIAQIMDRGLWRSAWTYDHFVPPEDFLEYDIEVVPAVLRDVVIEADAEMIRLIESGEAKVIAMVHLSNRDKVQAIKQKPVAYYQALVNDWTRGQTVKRVSDSVTPVMIGLKINRREVGEDLPE